MGGAGQIWRAWLATLKAVAQDKGALLLLVLAPLVYGFFYPWPYQTQAVTRVPVAVVDQDHSSLSRQMTRFANASPLLDVRLITADEREARYALWRGEIEGYAVLPADLKRDVVRGAATVVTVEANGSYALLNKAVLYGFAQAVGTVSAGVEIRKLQAGGQSALQARAARNPIDTQMVALFNPTEGYGSYVVPAVALLIIQQTLLMGVGLLVGLWTETGLHRANASTWLGRILGFSTVGYLSGLLYFGWIFLAQDFPRGANSDAALVLLAFYVVAICTVGALLGVWFGNRERALQVLLFTALPMVFVSGFSWPAEALPQVLQAARWLFPSTAGIQASLRLNQMGASLHDVWPHLMVLAAITAVAGGWLLKACTDRPVHARSALTLP